MTRKQALHKTLSIITDKELKDKLEEILDDIPFTGWSERTIFDTIDQFIIDNGRAPTTTDFKKKCLPPHPVIKLRFGITLKDFLNKYYPPDILCNSRIYYNKTRDAWKQLFISEYITNNPASAEDYNKKRPSNTPSWATVAKMFDVKKWLDWLEFCGIVPYINKRSPKNDRFKMIPFNVSSTLTMTDLSGSIYCVKKQSPGEFYIDKISSES